MFYAWKINTLILFMLTSSSPQTQVAGRLLLAGSGGQIAVCMQFNEAAPNRIVEDSLCPGPKPSLAELGLSDPPPVLLAPHRRL
jgi:hypothetical protein